MPANPSDVDRVYVSSRGVTSAWLNGVGSRLLNDARTDWRKWTDADLDPSTGQLLSRFNKLAGQLGVSHEATLTVNIAPGYVRYADGTTIEIGNVAANTGALLAVPDNMTTTVFIDGSGVPRASVSVPDGAVVLAEVMTSGGTVVSVTDKRAWFESALAFDADDGLATGWLVSSAVNTTRTAVDRELLFTDTAGGGFTVTLPASPALGTTVWIATDDTTSVAEPVTIDGNGVNINGGAEWDADTPLTLIRCFFDGTVWQTFNTTATSGLLPTIDPVVDTGKVLTVTADGKIAAIGWETITANKTAIAGASYFANTTGGAIILTLPATPTVDAVVTVVGNFDVNGLTVARNGSPLDGGTSNKNFIRHGTRATFVYDGTTWRSNVQYQDQPASTFTATLLSAGGNALFGLAVDPVTGTTVARSRVAAWRTVVTDLTGGYKFSLNNNAGSAALGAITHKTLFAGFGNVVGFDVNSGYRSIGIFDPTNGSAFDNITTTGDVMQLRMSDATTLVTQETPTAGASGTHTLRKYNSTTGALVGSYTIGTTIGGQGFMIHNGVIFLAMLDALRRISLNSMTLLSSTTYTGIGTSSCVAVDATNNRVFVATSVKTIADQATLFYFDLITGALLGNISIPATSVATDPAAGYIFVGGFSGVTVLDAVTLQTIGGIPAPSALLALQVVPTMRTLVIASDDTGSTGAGFPPSHVYSLYKY